MDSDDAVCGYFAGEDWRKVLIDKQNRHWCPGRRGGIRTCVELLLVLGFLFEVEGYWSNRWICCSGCFGWAGEGENLCSVYAFALLVYLEVGCQRSRI